MQIGTPEYCDTVDPQLAWRHDFLGLLLRVRSLCAFTGLGTAIGTCFLLRGQVLVGGGVLCLTGVLLLGFWVVRRARRRRGEAANMLHRICHDLRDDTYRIVGGDLPSSDFINQVAQFHQRIAQNIAVFFRSVVADPTVNCAIRLAEVVEGQRVYVTRARSDGLHPSRESISEPVPIDRGIAKTLMTHAATGVLIIRSIPKAIEAGMWMRTKADELSDVRTLMVCPINGWEGRAKVMLGILYVTSSRNPFSPIHTLPIRAIADILGLVYPMLVNSLGRTVSITRHQRGMPHADQDTEHTST